jgi:hypothetical protein
MLIGRQPRQSGFRFIGATSSSAPMIHAMAEIKDMMKWPFVCQEVVTGTPFAISAAKTPCPAIANPEITNSQRGRVWVRDRLEPTEIAIVPPATANRSPGTLNPIRFHSVAFGVPRAPNLTDRVRGM